MIHRAALLALITAGVLYTPAVVSQQSFEEWRAARDARYEDFQAAHHARYQAFLVEVQAHWGSASELSDQSTVVRYSEDLQSRVVIDYANSSISIDRADPDNTQEIDINSVLEQLRSLTVAQAAADDPVLQVAQQDDQRSLLDTFSGADSDALIGSAELSESTIEADMSTADSADPTQKRISRITLQLDQQGVFQRRAQPYMESVTQAAQDYDLEPALLLAIMQVESSFNPLAQSHIPAFGLMQIVPNSAGLDVNRMMYQIDQPPSSELLLQAEPNIIFGASYLSILSNQYLAGIENSQSRLLCMVAAYNTGAGNVASVFHPQGRRQIRPAIQKINELQPEQVYEQLLASLPYEETRLYLPKVMDAMSVYQSEGQPTAFNEKS
ncbi:MAG: transglycosylase SLT domain-containing protein [Idiomarina sp.]|nr:transglycosylase SLT domain-containing protein [Idiomarina sp.]